MCEWSPQDSLFQQYTQDTSLGPRFSCLSLSLLSRGQSAGRTDGEFSLKTMPHIWKEYKAAKMLDMFPREIRMLWKCVGSFPGSPSCCVFNRWAAWSSAGDLSCCGPVLGPVTGSCFLGSSVNWCLLRQVQLRCACWGRVPRTCTDLAQGRLQL